MQIIELIRDFVENECKKPESNYGYELFQFHITQMVGFAERLSNMYGGDKEVILIASLMHDIGSIIEGRKDHHLTGAEIAEKKLTELQYPQEKIELVKKCILNHRGSQNNNRDSIEEQIVAEADVMSAFKSISGLFKAALVYERLDQEEARYSVRKKLQQKWKQLHFNDSKIKIRPRFEAAMIILD